MLRLLLCMAGTGVFAAVCFASHTGEFVLVKAGRPQATLVLTQKPTVAAAFAVKEFQDHVQRII